MATKKQKQATTISKQTTKQQLRNLTAIDKAVEKAYLEAVKKYALLAAQAGTGSWGEDTLFSFDKEPLLKKAAQQVLQELNSRVESVVLNGINAQWTLANNKNNELANLVFGENKSKLHERQLRKYYSTNEGAREAFKTRATGVDGLNLSERVWKYSTQFKNEIELGIDLGLRDGLPAATMARDLKQYLQQPDKLFRRVRDEHGQLQLSKAAKEYHPGAGVYRSSFKNARRLAVTEGNIAFHTADQLKMQEMDFIVGIHIIKSNNHTLNGKPFTDICDELSGADENDPRGRYPKDFKFTGWHPHCRCSVITIMKTEEEMAEDTRKILAGEPIDNESINKINDTPQEFKDWLEQNEDRIARAKSLPYFMADNEQYCPEMKTTLQARAVADLAQRNNAMLVEAAKPAQKTPLEIAAERIAQAKNEFNALPSNEWIKEKFYEENGGYLTIAKERYEHGIINKAERDKYQKEHNMANIFAKNGHKVRMLKEESRTSSPDVLFDGFKADLKRTSSANNIVKYAKKAKNQQGAEIVLFQFDVKTQKVINELEKLKYKNIQVMYFFTGENIIYSL